MRHPVSVASFVALFALLLPVSRPQATTLPTSLGTSLSSTATAQLKVAAATTGRLWAWGGSAFGDLGSGANSSSSVPIQVLNLTHVVSVAAGGTHSLAVTSDGTVWAWGSDLHGELGNGTTNTAITAVPQHVNGIDSIVSVAAAMNLSVALRRDGTVWVWGLNPAVDPASGTPVQPTPVQVAGLTNVVKIAAGGNGEVAHILALDKNGSVWEWGVTYPCSLPGGAYCRTTTPTRIDQLGKDNVGIAAGTYHSLALKNTGTVWAWGTDILGNATTAESATPVRVGTLSGITAISANPVTQLGEGDHDLAVGPGGTVWAWGDNAYNQLGAASSDTCPVNGSQHPCSRLPVQVSGLTGVRLVAAGLRYSLAIKTDGTLWAWGDNSTGQLGTGTTTSSAVPVQVTSLTQVASIAAGIVHTLAIEGQPSNPGPGPNPPGKETLPIQYYFAGALATGHEHTQLALLNSTAQSVQAQLIFYFSNSATNTATVTIAAQTQRMVSLDDLTRYRGTFGLSVSTRQTLAAQLVVNRDGRDGDTLAGNAQLRQHWYLAAGDTRPTFHERVSILNPSATATASVQLQLLPSDQHRRRTVAVTVPAHTNSVVNINTLLPRSPVSIIADADQPVVVERTLTFSSNSGGQDYGMTMQQGTTSAATKWFFAEGTTTNGFETDLTILNPSSQPAHVTAQFYGSATPLLGSRSVTIAGQSSTTIKLNDILSGSGFATMVTSDQPVVAECAEYFGSPNSPRIAGSDVYGYPAAAVRWIFPAGDTQSGQTEYLLVYNPSAVTITINATFYGSNGTTVTRQISIPPSVRYNIDVNALLGNFDALHGVVLESTSTQGFIAEQAVFASDHSTMRGIQGLLPPASAQQPVTPVVPGGVWISPKMNFTVNSGDSLALAAHAYRTHKGDPAITRVEFTAGWRAGQYVNWMTICQLSKPSYSDVYECSFDLAQHHVPAGPLLVSFNVYDKAGNKNYAPSGERQGNVGKGIYLHAETGPLGNITTVSAAAGLSALNGNMAKVNYIWFDVSIAGTRCSGIGQPNVKIYSHGKVVWQRSPPNPPPTLLFGPGLSGDEKNEYVYFYESPSITVMRGNSYIIVGYATTASLLEMEQTEPGKAEPKCTEDVETGDLRLNIP